MARSSSKAQKGPVEHWMGTSLLVAMGLDVRTLGGRAEEGVESVAVASEDERNERPPTRGGQRALVPC